MSEIEPCGAPGFVERQLADERVLVGVAVAAIRREVPFYRSLDERGLADTAEVIGLALRVVLSCWEQGRLPEKIDTLPFPRLGVINGVVMRPLPAVQRGWRIGTRAVHEAVLERGAGTLSASDVAGLSRIVLAWLERIADAVLDAYSEVARDPASPGAPAARIQLVLSLITGSYSSTDMLRRRAAGVGISLPEPALVAVGSAIGAEPDLAARMVSFLARLDVSNESRLDLDLDGRAVFVIPLSGDAELEQATADAGLRLVVVGARDIDEVTSAYRTALRAADFLGSLGSSASRMYSDREARLAALLADELGPRPELAAIVDGLDAADEDELMATMLAYYETGSAESAAHRIGVHPQTVRYRLRGIRERTGLDPTIGWSRFAIELAVRVRAGTQGRGAG